MPLHDWTELAGWEGVHHSWITELLRWIKPRLPAGYRAYIGSAPLVAVGAPAEKPDVGVRKWDGEQAASDGPAAGPAPAPETGGKSSPTKRSLWSRLTRPRPCSWNVTGGWWRLSS
jgi:hypothetical protein